MSVGNQTVIDMTAILGYARVSTTGPDLDAHNAALTIGDLGLIRVHPFARRSLDLLPMLTSSP